MKAAEKLARRIVALRAGGDPDIGFKGYCEVQRPGCCLGRAMEYQHRKAKAHCNSEELWDPRNALMVCGFGNAGGCHGWIHQNPTAAGKKGWTVTSSLDPAVIPVQYRRLDAPQMLLAEPDADGRMFRDANRDELFALFGLYGGHPLTDEEAI